VAIKKGTIVLCRHREIEEVAPDHSYSLGVVTEDNEGVEKSGRISFTVRMLYPKYPKHIGEEGKVLLRDITPLGECPPGEKPEDQFPEIIISLVKERKVLKTQNKFLKEANKAL